MEQNLIFFSKILFFSCYIYEQNLDAKENYKLIVSSIIQYFNKNSNEELLKKIDKEKKKFIAFSERLNQKEIDKLKFNVNKLLEPKNDDVSDFDRKKEFIQSNIEYSSLIKRYTLNEKALHPENYIEVDNEIKKHENITKEINSNNSNFVLSLIAKNLEYNGIKVNVSKKKDNKIKKIELASIQSIFTLGTQKKYELHFDFGKENNEKILNDEKEKEKFITKYKEIIAKKLNIKSEKLIFTDVHHGCVGIYVSNADSNKETNEKLKKLVEELSFIEKVDEKPLLEAVQISPEILDPEGDRSFAWGINETRGGEEYIPPLKNWYGVGLKVKGQYDKGNDDWLDYRNLEGEFAIAYLGLHNFINTKDSLTEELNSITNDVKKMLKESSYEEDINIRDDSNFFTRLFGHSNKCKSGVCVFQNPDYAENMAVKIDIPDSSCRIKIILMCRVNPKNIRQPKNYKHCWIIDPTPENIRPYRLLFKKWTISPFEYQASQEIILSQTPVKYIMEAFKSNDFSFYETAKEYATCTNGKKLTNDELIINLYTGSYYPFLNNYLREKKVEFFTENKITSWICCFQSFLTKNSNVKNGTIVYRGIKKFKFSEEIGIGSKFYFREFTSSSLKLEVAENFAHQNNEDNQGTIMIITITNNGTNNHLKYCYYIEKITAVEGEEEIIIASHCSYTVTNIERNKDFDKVYLICEGYVLN